LPARLFGRRRAGVQPAAPAVHYSGGILVTDARTGIRNLGIALQHEILQKPRSLAMLLTHFDRDLLTTFGRPVKFFLVRNASSRMQSSKECVR
jgi:hypothetical protein